MSKGGKNKGKEKLPEPDKLTTRDEIGKIAGVSGKTIDNVEKILKEGTPEDITEVRDQLVELAGNNQYSPSLKSERGWRGG